MLHPLQRAFMAHHGLQCGFCTPGFLMLTVNMLEKNPAIGDEELLDVLSSNLCRCTGYQNIITAVKAVRDEMKPKEGPPGGLPHVEALPEETHASLAPEDEARISD